MRLNKTIKVIAKKIRFKRTRPKSPIAKAWKKYFEKAKEKKKTKGFDPDIYYKFAKKYKNKGGVGYIKRKFGLIKALARKKHNRKLLKKIDILYKKLDRIK